MKRARSWPAKIYSQKSDLLLKEFDDLPDRAPDVKQNGLLYYHQLFDHQWNV